MHGNQDVRDQSRYDNVAANDICALIESDGAQTNP